VTKFIFATEIIDFFMVIYYLKVLTFDI